jgi:fluoride exporter
MLSNIWLSMLLVGSGGFTGAIVRYWMTRVLNRNAPWGIPLGTLLVNVSGSYLLGWLWGHGVSQGWLALAGTGFMGAYTTFSTLKWESSALYTKGDRLAATVYLSMTYIIGVACAMLGNYS